MSGRPAHGSNLHCRVRVLNTGIYRPLRLKGRIR
jgi:hypothetical protein